MFDIYRLLSMVCYTRLADPQSPEDHVSSVLAYVAVVSYTQRYE
jgi:hypothetical protein